MDTRKVLVTGADGFVGSAMVRAFRGAGLTTYGLTRRRSGARALERGETIPIIADVGDLPALDGARDIGFDIIVSNTEDSRDPAGHLAKVSAMLAHLTSPPQTDARRKPLVMFTSGSKDYGNMDEGAGDADLHPHTEAFPLRPHPFAAARAHFARSLLGRTDVPYDVVVLRPALMCGRAAGLFGLLFDFAASGTGTLVLNARPNAVMHAVHVDDCAAADVAIAQHPDRGAVAGQAFNIANAGFETTEQVATALAKVYRRDLAFDAPDNELSVFNAHLLANTSQWVGSTKIRDLTGWTEVMPGLSMGMPEYRMAYEAARPS